MLRYRSQKFEENPRGARSSPFVNKELLPEHSMLSSFMLSDSIRGAPVTWGETPSRSPSCAQQSSLSPAFGVTLSSWAGKRGTVCATLSDLSKQKRLLMKCPGLLRTLGIHTELQLKSSGSLHPENAVSRRKGHCLMGRSVIRLRSLCNAEVQVLCESQAGFSLHPEIVNVNAIVNVKC